MKINNTQCSICNTSHPDLLHEYTSPPAGETVFPFSSSDRYRRSIVACRRCHHMMSFHDYNLNDFYDESYGTSTYGKKGIQATFDRIMGLPEGKSDNSGRVKKILEYHSKYHVTTTSVPSVLDVGAGLCVFLYKMKAAGWNCAAVEPDRRMAAHARDTLEVQTFCGSFTELPQGDAYDYLTFNKVLEHVVDPVEMLKKAKLHLKKSGMVYIELPDGEAAWKEGPGREEFFIEHYHIFSLASVCLLAQKAGFMPLEIERLQEPSTKYTIRALLAPES